MYRGEGHRTWGRVELGRWGLRSGVLARPASCCRHLGSCDVDCQTSPLDFDYFFGRSPEPENYHGFSSSFPSFSITLPWFYRQAFGSRNAGFRLLFRSKFGRAAGKGRLEVNRVGFGDGWNRSSRENVIE